MFQSILLLQINNISIYERLIELINFFKVSIQKTYAFNTKKKNVKKLITNNNISALRCRGNCSGLTN